MSKDPSCPEGKIRYIEFHGNGTTVIWVDVIPVEIYTDSSHFAPLLETARLQKLKITVSAPECESTLNETFVFNEFTVLSPIHDL